MNPKIIVADDSQTIQKVIKITLANEDFELVECLDYANLNDLVAEHAPLVVLLDFNISESKTGYDISKELKDQGVSKIFMLYGTFDTIDEKLLEHAGANAHIVKPFEGNKFINSCRQLVEDALYEKENPSTDDFQEIKVEEEELPDDLEEVVVEGEEVVEETIEEPEAIVEEEDQWVVNQPDVITEEEDDTTVDEIITEAEHNSLEAGMKEWGIDIPGVIGSAESDKIDLPPVIEKVETEFRDSVIEEPAPIEEPTETAQEVVEESTALDTDSTGEFDTTQLISNTQTETEEEKEEELLPENDDLEYPDIDMIKSTIEAETIEPSSKLVSIAELSEENSADQSEFDNSAGTRTEEEVRALEAQIADEVDEGNFWSADEVIEGEGTDIVVETKEEEKIIIDTQAQPEEEKIEQVAASANISSDQIEAHLEPIIEKLVNERVEAILEKIAWEVIPDLAENLIKKELKEISKEITNSNNN